MTGGRLCGPAAPGGSVAGRDAAHDAGCEGGPSRRCNDAGCEGGPSWRLADAAAAVAASGAGAEFWPAAGR